MEFLIPTIQQPFDCELAIPGSKSIALRQMAISALTPGITTLHGVPQSDDIAAMRDCLTALGVEIEAAGHTLTLKGPMQYDHEAHLDARMSGASTRLLIGLAALRHGQTHIDGHESLRVRPNQPLYDALRAHGCAVTAPSPGLPVTLQGPLALEGNFTIDGTLSSQYLTALMTIAPLLPSTAPVVITVSGELVSRPYIEITRNEMAKRGIQTNWIDANTLSITPGTYKGGEYWVEGDATGASYAASLALVHASRVTLTNLGTTTVQGDYEYFSVLERLGAQIVRSEEQTTIVGTNTLQALPSIDMTSMPDAALTLIALAPLLPQPIHITGLSTLHHKECDRLECSATELKRLGVSVRTTEESIIIHPVRSDSWNESTISTYHDHRMAMAFSVLGSVLGGITVDDKAVVNKTYPDYWQDYARLAGQT